MPDASQAERLLIDGRLVPAADGGTSTSPCGPACRSSSAPAKDFDNAVGGNPGRPV
ncbi:MAG: hypothetical protein QOE54_6201 [Streptosporangiaceae bacterium]|jgi:hypothetical protein|nr:hypothetical protein [Streptosporangiaceae bacterium]MDX6433835.1 hypothetical protein [Streptosporangiaceae bacterium]